MKRQGEGTKRGGVGSRSVRRSRQHGSSESASIGLTEAAKTYGFSRKYLQRLLSQGKLKARKDRFKYWWIERTAMERLRIDRDERESIAGSSAKVA